MADPIVVTLLETALSSVAGPSSSVVNLAYMSAAERAPILRAMHASNLFRQLPADIAQWMQRIKVLRIESPRWLARYGQLMPKDVGFHSALAKLEAEEAYLAHATRIAAADSAAAAAEGTLVAGAGTTVAAIVIPVVAMVAVQVAMGAPYYQAREQARKEEYARGFARGFITGLLKWELRFTIERFWDKALGQNGFDDDMPKIRARAHNEALLEGRVAGLAKNDREKKTYLSALKKLTSASSAGWTPRSENWSDRMRARRVQIDYVIEFAVAARKHGIVVFE